MTHRSLAAFALLTVACGSSSPEAQQAAEPADAPAPSAAPHAEADFTDPDSCKTCHEAVVAEWKQSMHSRAHASNDPIFAGMRALRMKKQGEQVAAKCAKCHNPMAPEDPDSPAGKHGVSCGACHQAPDAALVADDGRTVCMQCHDATKNPQGAATCTTGPENESMGKVPCTSCHMRPTEDGHAAHRFDGPHRAWYQDDPSFLATSVGLQLEREGDVVTAKLTNLTGHAFPSGFPGRIAVVKLGAGEWSAPAFTLRKVYVDEAGKPTMPPFAAELKEDSRLKPGETREARIEVPAGTGPVTGALVYHLVPPPAVGPLGLEGRPEAEPKVIPLP